MILRTLALFSFLASIAWATVPNGGFENDLQNWDATGDGGMSTVSPDSARSGKAGLHVVDDNPKGGSSLVSPKMPADAERSYKLVFQGRFLSGKGSLAVYLRFYDENGVQLNPYPKFTDIIELREGSEWKKYERTFKAPVGTKTCDVWIHSYGSAIVTADVDDVDVLPADAKAPAAAPAPKASSSTGEKWLTADRIAKLPRKKVASAEATAAEKASADFICEGTADEVKINEAATQAKVVELVGPTFTIASPIRLGDNVLLGAGSDRTTIRMSGKMDTGLYIRGGKTTLGDAERLEKGSTTFAWKASSSGTVPAAGDYLLIHSDDWFTGTRGYYWRGEVTRAVKATATEIAIERLDDRQGAAKGLWDTYTTKPRVYRLDLLTDVGIQGIRMIGPSSAVRHRIIRGEFLLRPFFRDVKLDGLDSCHEGLSLNPVVDVLIEKCDIRNVGDSMSTTYSTGYAYYVTGHGGIIRGCTGSRNRHSFEWGGYSSATVKTPVTRRLVTMDCTVTDDWSSAFSTHDPCEDNEWIRCKTVNCGGGFIMRGTAWTLVEPQVLGVIARERPSPDWWGNHKSWSYNNAIYIGEKSQQGGTDPAFAGIGGVRSRILRARIDLSKTTDVRPNLIYAEDDADDLQVLGGTFIASPTSATGILLRGLTNRGVVIDGAKFDMSLQEDGLFMEVNPGDDSTRPIDVTLRNCEIIKPFKASPLVTSRTEETIILEKNKVEER